MTGDSKLTMELDSYFYEWAQKLLEIPKEEWNVLCYEAAKTLHTETFEELGQKYRDDFKKHISNFHSKEMSS
jgi:hypothetical protein